MRRNIHPIYHDYCKPNGSIGAPYLDKSSSHTNLASMGPFAAISAASLNPVCMLFCWFRYFARIRDRKSCVRDASVRRLCEEEDGLVAVQIQRPMMRCCVSLAMLTGPRATMHTWLGSTPSCTETTHRWREFLISIVHNVHVRTSCVFQACLQGRILRHGDDPSRIQYQRGRYRSARATHFIGRYRRCWSKRYWSGR